MNTSLGPNIVATGIAWTGALIATVLRGGGDRLIRPLVYLALLFFGASAIFDILPESKQVLSWPIFIAAVSAGYILFWLTGRYVAPVCPACAMKSFEVDHHHGGALGEVVLAAVLGLHCFSDGLGVGAASRIEPAFGLRLFAAIAVHKLPEGFALGLILMAGGRLPWGAFAIAAAVELSTLVGGLAGAVWMHPSAFWLAFVLANIGGMFLYLAVSGLWDALASAPAKSLPGTRVYGSRCMLP